MANLVNIKPLIFRKDELPYCQLSTGAKYMQMDRYITTTERRLPDGERNKPADTQKYQIRKRRVVQCSIEFDLGLTPLGQLNDFMKQEGVGRLQIASGGRSYGPAFGRETTDYQWLMDNAEMVEDRTGVARLSLQFSKYTQWTDEQTALSLEDLGKNG